MVSVEEVRSQINSARKNAQEQREQVTLRRQEASSVESTIIEQEKKLPKKSQRLLRSGLFAGLEGRKRRRVVEGAKKELSKGKEEVNQFRTELDKFEKEELEPFEKDISKREAELGEFTKHQNAISIARRVASGEKSVWSLQGNKLAQRYHQDIQANIIVEAPGGFIFDSSGKSIGSVEEPKSVPGFPMDKLPKINSPKLMSLAPPRDLKRTDLSKDFSKIKSISLPRLKSNLSDSSFKTTGSPLRITKLSSLKSRGYSPSTNKSKFLNPPKKKKLKPNLPNKRKKKSKPNFDFLGKGTKKKKLNPIWEF